MTEPTLNELTAASLATTRVIDVLHVNQADHDSDRRLNEYGSKRPALSVVVGRLTVLPGENANQKAWETFPPPDGWFTTYRRVRIDAANQRVPDAAGEEPAP